eukprot:COSAG05_NODE_18268_length_311_cov_0.566038_1_plen_85_part_01
MESATVQAEAEAAAVAQSKKLQQEHTEELKMRDQQLQQVEQAHARKEQEQQTAIGTLEEMLAGMKERLDASEEQSATLRREASEA